MRENRTALPTIPPAMGPTFNDPLFPLVLPVLDSDPFVGDGLLVPVCVVREFVAVDSGAERVDAT